MHDHHHHTYAASETASVVLTIGDGVGALILYVPETLQGHEIEISGTSGARTHAAVRERRLEDESVYCVVYDGLAEGEYTLWASADRPAGTLHVLGDQVSEASWDGAGIVAAV